MASTRKSIPVPGYLHWLRLILPLLSSIRQKAILLSVIFSPPFTSLKRGSPDFNPGCGLGDDVYTNVNDVFACYRYLPGIDSNSCRTSNRDFTGMCVSGSARIGGFAQDVGHLLFAVHLLLVPQILVDDLMVLNSFLSFSVAFAVLWIGSCTRPHHEVAGFAPVDDNDDLIITDMNQGIGIIVECLLFEVRFMALWPTL
ncbi:hypothetical protein BDZ45DRAFT_751480 [Acephala macrosclerotiorum]|nr:hypothetical protein BDZ45DRAFT_751480 [Acephala macrosclerotiorum]